MVPPKIGADRDALRRFSVSFYAAPEDFPIDRFCRCLAARDVGGIGITPAVVETTSAASLARLLAQHDLRASSVNSTGYLLHADPEAARRQATLDDRLFDVSAALDAPLNVIPGGVVHAARGDATPSLRLLRAQVEDGLGRLAERAEQAGVVLSLEPIHPMSIGIRGCINQLSHALASIDRHPGFRLTLDLFHSWWDAGLPSLAADQAAQIAVLQICGLVVPPDGSPPRRGELRQGDREARALLTALAGAYQGLIEYEVFYEQMGRPELEGLIDRSIEDFLSLDPERRAVTSHQTDQASPTGE